jgi:hypothetical protein
MDGLNAFAFAKISIKYGNYIAYWTEKVMRLESADFESEIYRKTGCGGMLAFNPLYPYGWTFELKPFWDANFDMQPVGILGVFNNSKNKYFHYLQFTGTNGLNAVAEVLTKKTRIGGYFSSIESKQIEYEGRLSNKTNLYTHL